MQQQTFKTNIVKTNIVKFLDIYLIVSIFAGLFLLCLFLHVYFCMLIFACLFSPVYFCRFIFECLFFPVYFRMFIFCRFSSCL